MGEGVPPKLNTDANPLSHSVSSDFHKTNNLKYNSSMEVHGQSLLQEGQAADIHNLVKLQHLIEQIGELHVRSTKLPALSQSHSRSMILEWIQHFSSLETLRACNTPLLYRLPSPNNLS
jgi:hypothetical protein